MLVAGSEGEEFEDISTQVNTKNNLDIFEDPFSLKKTQNWVEFLDSVRHFWSRSRHDDRRARISKLDGQAWQVYRPRSAWMCHQVRWSRRKRCDWQKRIPSNRLQEDFRRPTARKKINWKLNAIFFTIFALES